MVGVDAAAGEGELWLGDPFGGAVGAFADVPAVVEQFVIRWAAWVSLSMFVSPPVAHWSRWWTSQR